MSLRYLGQLVVPGFVDFDWPSRFTVCALFRRSLRGSFQSVVGNGYSSLSSWELRMPPNSGATDDIGLYLSMEVLLRLFSLLHSTR